MFPQFAFLLKVAIQIKSHLNVILYLFVFCIIIAFESIFELCYSTVAVHLIHVCLCFFLVVTHFMVSRGFAVEGMSQQDPA